MSSTRITTLSNPNSGNSNTMTASPSRYEESFGSPSNIGQDLEPESQRHTHSTVTSTKERGASYNSNDSSRKKTPQTTKKGHKSLLSASRPPASSHLQSSRASPTSVPSTKTPRMTSSPPTQQSSLREQSSQPHAASMVTSTLPPPPLARITGDSTTRVCLCQPDPKIPRPRNAFILYRQHLQSAFVADHPELSNPEISKLIGKRWQAEPVEIKSQWKNLAEEEKLRHQQTYPDYRYIPRRTGSNSTVRSNISLLSSPSPSSGGQPPITLCAKCGGRSITAPSTPRTPFTPSFKPPPASSIPFSTAGRDPPTLTMNTPIIGPPQQRRYPLGLNLQRYSPQHQPQQQQNQGSPKSGGMTGVLVPQTRLRDLRDEEMLIPLSPDSKRRKYNHPGSYTPATASAYTFPVRRESLTHPDMALRPAQTQGQQISMGPPPPPSARLVPLEPSLTLPPLQTPASSTSMEHEQANIEAVLRNIPFLNKIRVLNRISRSLRASVSTLPSATSPPSASAGARRLSDYSNSNNIRGAIIAVEGPDEGLRDAVVKWLERYLSKNQEHLVRLEDQGPRNPFIGQREITNEMGNTRETAMDVDVNDALKTDKNTDELFARYLRFVAEWHGKSREIIQFITSSSATVSNNATTPVTHQSPSSSPVRLPSTASPTSETIIVHTPILANQNKRPTTPTKTNKSPTTSKNLKLTSPQMPKPTPIALLNTYMLTHTNTAALALPILDAYAAVDHWQWIATLWRGVVGADITVYVKEASAEEIARFGAVEVRPDAGAVVVRVAGTGGGAGKGGELKSEVEEKTLRRLGFEVGEWIQGLGVREDEGEGEQRRSSISEI